MHVVNMTPMDYHLIAGDDLFFNWRGLRVIERGEAIQLADDEGLWNYSVAKSYYLVQRMKVILFRHT